MNGDAWNFEHSVECQATKDFAWQFWSNVKNWEVVDPGVEWVRIDGPFASGTKGVTKPRGSDLAEWTLVDVQPGKSAIVEIAIPGAIVRFKWIFEDSEQGGAKLIQKVTLEGEQADNYTEGMKGLEQGIPSGMQKLADAIDKAASGATS
jgi:hypothetical protein